MIFTPTTLVDAYVIDVERHSDERGFFARSWCRREALEHGIDVEWVQCNISQNQKRGTLRGMHFQHPDWEGKLVRATRGAIFDAIVDLRVGSSSYLQSIAVELSAETHRALYVPAGFAHGFMTLEDDTEIFYQMSEYYVPGQDKGFRFDDPQFAIAWPEGEKVISERDRNLPFFQV
jgi:dTDP-4-dehydrorhamnose 3,5-epimerase